MMGALPAAGVAPQDAGSGYHWSSGDSGRSSAREQVPGLPPMHFGSDVLLRWFQRIDFAVACVMLLLARASVPLAGQAWYSQTLPMGHVLSAVAAAFVWRGLAGAVGLYTERRIVSWRAELDRLAVVALIGFCIAVMLDYFLGPKVSPKRALHLAELVLVANAARIMIRVITRTWLRQASVKGVRRVLVVGTGPRAAMCTRAFQQQPWCRYSVIGYLDSDPQSATPEIGAHTLGSFDALETILEREVIDEVHVALPIKSCYAVAQNTIDACARVGVPVVYSTDLFGDQRDAHRLQSSPDASSSVRLDVVPPGVRLVLKRVLDVTLSGVALVLLAPLFLAVTIAVRLSGPGPIFFRQSRWSQHRRVFRLYKFRSMRTDAEEVLRLNPELFASYVRNNFKLPVDQDPRVTRIGRFLRQCSLDELPQIWNVFRGDMSIIGPRPIVPAEIQHYGPVASLLLALKPGLTGAWVVGGRNMVGYPQRAEVELGYVRCWSLVEDVAILFRTIPRILRRQGAS